ncbi:XkdQ/YqbQ family protein [Abyssisolibacter fermentans]|uniref:XkdQ/YqbQ family protein n=1 Tax=Abyssisolibacter fermentans TaxID=1766203 RepID=UPI00082F55E5|nr:hypothetical protein [Abyssisolibacter fermentans]
MHKFYCITNGIQTDITPLVRSIKWRSNINELGNQLDFEIAFNDSRYFPSIPVELGSVVIIKNEEEIFRGIVISKQNSGRNVVSYTCFDYAIYLNKSKEVYQFNKTSAKKAIETILNDFKIPIGKIAPISTVINKIYNNKLVSDIIRDIISTAEKEKGIKYRMEMRQGKLFIENQEDLVIKATFKLAQNIQDYDVTSSISNPSRKQTIENMKNSIKVIDTNNKVIEQRDQKLIDKYGLLQDVMLTEHKDTAKAKNLAEKMLKDLGKVMEENSVEMIGNDSVRAGRLIEIREPITGMSGQYLIKDVNHTLTNGIHRMQVGLGVK